MTSKSVLDVTQKKPILYAPYSHSQDTCLRLENMGTTRLGWKIKCTNNLRYKIRPVTGILEPKEVTEAFVSIQPIDEDEVEDALGITHKDARDEIDRTKLWETDGDVIKEDIKLYFINPKGIGKDPFFVHIPVDNTQALTH